MPVHLCSRPGTIKCTVISEFAFLPVCPFQLQILILQIPTDMNDNRNTARHWRTINLYRYVADRIARADNATAQFVTKNKQAYEQKHASFDFPYRNQTRTEKWKQRGKLAIQERHKIYISCHYISMRIIVILKGTAHVPKQTFQNRETL